MVYKALIVGIALLLCLVGKTKAQNAASARTPQLTRMCIYNGDTIPYVPLRTVYVFKPMVFNSKRQQVKYERLVRDVKKVLPIAKEVNRAVIETYEYMQTIPTEKGRKQHIRNLEKGLKKQYTPRLKKLNLRQGKLLIKLIDRENNQTSYELVKAFLGSFKAGTYQLFASMFGASLKKEYDPDGDDKVTEMVVVLVENGQL